MNFEPAPAPFHLATQDVPYPADDEASFKDSSL